MGRVIIFNSMYNIYKNEKNKVDSSQLRIIDYRNSKYQGTTVGVQMTREGVGMILDHNYLLAIATWKEGFVDGPAIIVFPDCTIFYGFLKNRLPVGIGCYQVSAKLQIYSLIGSGEEDFFVLDDNNNKNMILLTASKQIMQQLYEQPIAFEHLIRDTSQTTKVKIEKQVNYTSAEQKWQTIEGFFKTVFLNQLKSYKQFIKHYFQTQVKNSQPKIQIIQTKEEVQFNYHNSSIVCKIEQRSESDSDFRIKLLGYYNHNDHQFQIAKKITFKSDIVQQIIENFKTEYPSNNRSAVCMRHLQTYFRKSLNFINDFVEIDYLYRIKFIYHSIEVGIGQFSIKKSAQKLLQKTNSPQAKNQRERPSKPRSIIDEEGVSKEHINRVKDDIYKAVKSRSQSRTKSISNSQLKYQPPQKFSISRITDQPYRPRQVGEPHPRQFIDPPSLSPGKRSYIYLGQQMQRTKIKKNSPSKYEYIKSFNGRRETANTEGKLNKFKYLNESAKPRKLQNLTTLTNYYEEIENQLRKQTPRATQRKYRNIDGYSKGQDKIKPSTTAYEQSQKIPKGSRNVFKHGQQ